MKSNKTVKGCISLAITALFLLSMLAGVPFAGPVQTARADSGAAAPATNLPVDAGAAAQLKALGLPVDQPSRTDTAGKVIDKNTSTPFGARELVLNKTLQLATAGVGNDSNNLYDIYDKPINGSGNIDYSHPLLGKDKLAGSATDSAGDWRQRTKAMTSADLMGSGRDAVVTAALPSISQNNVELVLCISDYNGGKPIEKEMVLVPSLAKPRGYTDQTLYPIHIAAGDFDHDGIDEIAIAVGRTLYMCKVVESASGDLSASILSTVTFDSSNTLAQVNDTDSDRPVLELQAYDADGDGYKELLVSTGSTNGGSTYTPRLLIYHGTDLSSPVYNEELQENNSRIFKSPSIAVGDIFGDGAKEIAIGGMTTSSYNYNAFLTYIKYNPVTNTYEDVGTHPFYDLIINKVLSSYVGLNFVSLETPTPGKGQFIVFGDDIFRYDPSANNGQGGFIKHNVSNSIYGGGNITGANYTGNDFTLILNTIVGNFDGNTQGKEQIIMLHWNSWWGGNWEYITSCGEDGNGNITSQLWLIWHDAPFYYYPQICAPDVKDNGLRLEYDHSEFTYSDPQVVAVLGAAPYYKELNYGGNLTSATTTLGTDAENRGLKLTAGVSFGYANNSSIYGLQVGNTDLETLLKQKFTPPWSSAMRVSKNFGFTVNNNEDKVVVSTIPYDVYYYNVYHSGSKETLNINVPYAPVLKVMSLNDYNQAVAANKLTTVPMVGTDVLKHTAGDPRTYPGDGANLSNVSGKSMIKGSDFVDAGIGNNLATQSIPPNWSASAIDTSINEDLTFRGATDGINVGMKGKSGNGANVTLTVSPVIWNWVRGLLGFTYEHLDSPGTTMEGSVANLPQSNNNYGFAWKLAAYNYDLPLGNAAQRCLVLSYLVSAAGMPPGVPGNLQAASVSNTSVTLQWDKVSTATGYVIKRSAAKDGPYTDVGNVQRIDTTTYTDTGVAGNQTYYYEVAASASVVGMPSDPLTVQTIAVKSISVDTQPGLTYTKGDHLDLSSLVVGLHMIDGSTQEVKFADFAAKSLTVSLDNGTALPVTDNGVPITVTFTPNGLSAQTDRLTVSVDDSHNCTVSAEFKVGSTDNATALSPNALLTANATVTNNKSSAQSVMVVVALYDGQGNPVNISYLPQNIAAGASVDTVASFRLPADVTNYAAKVFVWDGQDISSSSKTLQSNVVQIP